MIDLVLFIVVLFFIIIVTTIIYFKEPFSPIVLFGVPITIQYIIYYYVYSDVYTLSNSTLFIYTLGLMFFIIGHLFYRLMIREKISDNDWNSLIHGKSNYIVIYSCLIIGIVFLIMTQNYLNSFGVGASNFSSDSLNIRENFINNLAKVPFYVIYGKYFLLFSISYIWYDFLTGKKNINKGLMFGLLLLLFYNAFSVYSRTDLLISILPIFIIFIRIKILNTNLQKKIEMKKVRKQVIGLTLALFLLLILMNSTREVENSTSFFSVNNQVMQYIGRPLIAFDQWVLQHPKSSNQLLTFEPLNKVLLSIGVFEGSNVALSPKGQFNVFSYLRAPYMDFGFIGVPIIMFIVGIACHYFYLKFKSNSKSWIIFYSVFAYGIIMSFFDWQFFIITFVYLGVFIFFVDKIRL